MDFRNGSSTFLNHLSGTKWHFSVRPDNFAIDFVRPIILDDPAGLEEHTFSDEELQLRLPYEGPMATVISLSGSCRGVLGKHSFYSVESGRRARNPFIY